MQMYYTNNKLYVDIDEKLDMFLIKKLRKRIYRIIDDYAINDVILNILSNEHYDSSLIDDFINDYNNRYGGNLIIK